MLGTMGYYTAFETCVSWVDLLTSGFATEILYVIKHALSI
jgi:hypothetical protein